MRDDKGRLYLLDVLRGLAALAVVVWHYQHHYAFRSPDFDRAIQPFYDVLWPLYERGFKAVTLFFVLSGFVFFHQYSEAVRSRAVSARDFFILRFSRLYPLHFATLALVAVGQHISTAIDGRSIVYQCNDAGYFFLNVLFVTDWLPKAGYCYSFNGPVWSVSAEVFLYAVFFVFALFLPASWWGRVAATLGALALAQIAQRARLYHLLGAPAFAFFSGGLTFLIWQRLLSVDTSRWHIVASTGVLFAVALPAGFKCSFPAAILFLATLQSAVPRLGYRMRALGDISYATYLVHFPLTLALLLAAKLGAFDQSFLWGKAGWLAYFALLIAISVPTFYLFERPFQNAIRRRYWRGRRIQPVADTARAKPAGARAFSGP